MRFVFGLLIFSLSLVVFADNGETRRFLYDGSQSTFEMLLRGEETHTEYRNEQRNTTCYRTVIVGHSTVCHPLPPGPGRRPVPGPRNCQVIPIYRQVGYPCVETVSVPYEVKDFDVEAKVVVDIKKLKPEIQSVEDIKVSLNGVKVTLDFNGSKKFFAILKDRKTKTDLRGSVKFVESVYQIELLETAPVLGALDVKNISVEDSKLNFNLGKETLGTALGFALNVTKRPIFGRNTVLIDRELAPAEYSIKGDSVTFDLATIGVEVRGGRFGVTPKVFFKYADKVLNKQQFEELEASNTLILKR